MQFPWKFKCFIMQWIANRLRKKFFFYRHLELLYTTWKNSNKLIIDITEKSPHTQIHGIYRPLQVINWLKHKAVLLIFYSIVIMKIFDAVEDVSSSWWSLPVKTRKQLPRQFSPCKIQRKQTRPHHLSNLVVKEQNVFTILTSKALVTTSSF